MGRKLPAAFKANAQAMKKGEHLSKKSGGKVPPKNISKRKSAKKGR